jgi:hypothetical protein
LIGCDDSYRDIVSSRVRTATPAYGWRIDPHQRRGDERGSVAGAEIADREVARILALCQPIRGADEPFGQQAEVELQMCHTSPRGKHI